MLGTASPVLAQTQTNPTKDVDILLERHKDHVLITLLNKGEAFDGVLSSLVFTLEWSGSDRTILNRIEMKDSPALMMVRANEGQSGALNQVTFNAIGIIPLAEDRSIVKWGKGERLELIRLTEPEALTRFLTIATDKRTVANNCGYYVALGGIDHTGEVLVSQGPLTAGDPPASIVETGVEPENFMAHDRMRVFPSPTAARTLFIDFQGMSDEGSLVAITVLDASGRAVRSLTFRSPAPGGHLLLDMEGFSGGVYTVRCDYAGKNFLERVVLTQ